PSGPAVIEVGEVPTVNCVMTPTGVIRPIAPLASVNHRLPSAPAVISPGALPDARPWENSVMTPEGVIRPIAWRSVNQRLPSGPRVIPRGWALGVGIPNSRIAGLGIAWATTAVLAAVVVLPSLSRIVTLIGIADPLWA